MYFVGFLFGLGFDTATQVGLLGIAAAAGTQGVPIWSILLFPLLFTAGMCIVDTADGILMLGAYGWAFVHPIRKLYYNMTITAVSVFIALVVGAIEVLSLVSDQFNLQGSFWDRINALDFVRGSGWPSSPYSSVAGSSPSSPIVMLGYKRLEIAVAESFAPPLPDDGSPLIS